MATVTEFKRNLLRGLNWDAQDRALPLEATLKQAVRARVDETKTGLALVGASGNGQSVTFALPQSASAFSPDQIAIATGELYDLYEAAIAELDADGNDSPTDSQIATRMLAMLKPVRAFKTSFANLALA